MMPLFFQVLEFALAAWLLLWLPAWALWKSLYKSDRPKRDRAAGFRHGAAMIAVMLLILAFITWGSGWSPVVLGFDLPLSRGGAIGLVIAVSVIIVFAAVNALWKRRHPEKVERALREIESNPMLPRTPVEMRWAMVFLLAAGTGWEILYRGFLLWVLMPLIGVAGAVCVAAIAYGLAHGYKSRGQLIGSVLASFAFTVAFALTGSLWWLMLLHVVAGAPLVWNGRRAMRNQVPRVADDGQELPA